jgi:hypothetical protein
MEGGEKKVFFLKKYLVDKKRVSTFAAPQAKEVKRGDGLKAGKTF